MKHNGIKIDEMTGPQCVAAYNELTGGEVKRFSNTAVGRRRVRQALEAKQGADNTTAKPAKKPAKKATDEAAKVPADRSAAQAKSWQDEDIRVKRSQRNGVKVGKETYRSVKQAFEALGLPLNQHIKFRMALKASEDGRLQFKHEGKQVTFKLLVE